MAYTLLKLLRAGDYTGTDWRPQFDAATLIAAVPTMAGEVFYPGSDSHYGIYAAFAFFCNNPYDQTVCIPDATIDSPVQVFWNGTLLSQLTADASLPCPTLPGVNIFEIVRKTGPLVVMPSGPFFDPLGQHGRWLSPYPAGSDPFVGQGGGIGKSSVSISSLDPSGR